MCLCGFSQGAAGEPGKPGQDGKPVKKKKSYKKSQQNEFEFNISSLHFYLNISYLYSAMTQDSQEISDSIYYTAGVNANSNARL